MKKALAAGFLAFVMVWNAGTVLADTDNVEQLDYTASLHYELEPLGSLEDPDGSFAFLYNALLDRSYENVTMLSSSGEVMVENLADLDYIGGGLYITRTPLEEDNVNTKGLYTSDGEVLIPGDAASIITPTNREEDGSFRFLGVIFTTERTDNEDDCIIYFTSDMFSFSVGEDDVMYKGCCKVYDVLKKQYVPGVELTSAARYGLHDLGDSFIVEHDGKFTQYDPDGKVLYESDEILNYTTYNSFAIGEDSKYKIIDSTGRETFVSEDYQYISSVSEPLNYYSIRDVEEDTDANLHLIDMNGNRVLEDPQHIFYNAFSTVFVADDTDGNKVVLDYEGDVIDNEADTCYFPLGGYGVITHDNTDSVTAITPEGIMENLTGYSTSNLIFTKDDRIINLSTGEAIGTGYTGDDTGDTFCPGLVTIYDPTSDRYADPKVSLYDVLSGEELLPNEYQEIKAAGNNVYANPIGTDTWEVYRIHIVSNAA